eukprot:gene4547-5145_t
MLEEAKGNRRIQSPRTESKKLEQLYIDVGQRDFGHTACETCGMVYTKTLEEDSLQHAKYHQKMMQRLKFKGWKTERILQEFHDGRIIQINPDDSSLHQRKVVQLREIVDGDLGFSYSKMHHQDQEKAYRAMLTTNNSAINTTENQLTQTWCCSSDPVPAVCGISRIWVLKQARRKNIASRLVDAVRNYFIFGVVIAKTKLAFSDPTTDGRLFAQSYSAKDNKPTVWYSLNGERLGTYDGHNGAVWTNDVTCGMPEPYLRIPIQESKITPLFGVLLFDMDNMSQLKLYKTERPVNSASLSPIKDHVVLGGGQEAMDVTTTSARVGKFDARFFHMVFEEEIGRVKGHFGPINSVVFHPDGKSYSSGGEDGYVRVHTFDPSYYDFKIDF